MLEKYFSAPKTLRRLRSGISGPHIDAFADDLERDGYARPARSIPSSCCPSRLLRSAQRRRSGRHRFQNASCFCWPSLPLPMPSLQASKDRLSRAFWSEAFPSTPGCGGICPSECVRTRTSIQLLSLPSRLVSTHRGAKPPTLRLYARGAAELLQASARMSANGLRMPYATFFYNVPVNVELRPHRS